MAGKFGFIFKSNITSLSDLNKPLCANIGSAALFCTSYIPDINGHGDNYMFGIATRGSSSEIQIGIGLTNKKWYIRTLSLNDGSFTAWSLL